MIVIVTVLSTKSLHNTTNSYLVSLAMADLITLFASCPQVLIIYFVRNFGGFPYFLGDHRTVPPTFFYNLKIRRGIFLF